MASSWLAGIATDASSAIEHALQPYWGSGERRATPKRQREETGLDVADCPFQPAQASWVLEAVTISQSGATNALATAVEQQLLPMRQKAAEHDAKLQEHGALLAGLQTENDELKEKMKVIEDNLTTVQEQLANAGSSSGLHAHPETPGGPVGRSPVRSPDTVDPRHAIMGNLGWDLSADELKQRATALLAEAGVNPESWNHMSPARVPGSAVELLFTSSERLNEATLAARALRKFVDQSQQQQDQKSKPAWLDIKKSSAQLFPARLTHRTHDYLKHIESTATSPGTITKDLVHKTVSRNNVIMGRVVSSVWKWDPVAQETYTDDIRDHCASFAAAI